MNKTVFALALTFAFAHQSCIALAHQPTEIMKGSIAAKMDAIFKKYNHTKGPRCAIAVIKDGKVILETSYGMADLEYKVPITSNSMFDICSLTKQFTGLAISMLVQQGTISLNDDIRKYLPLVPDFGKVITIGNLIHHTSGLRDYPEALMIAGWRYSELCTLEDVMRLVARQKELDFDPGSQWSYSNTGYVLLAALVEKVTGVSFPDWIKRHIFQPLGMNRSFIRADSRTLVPHLATSYATTEHGYLKYPDALSAYSSSCMVSCLDDLSKWVIHLQAEIDVKDPVYTRMLDKVHLNNGDPINYAYGLEIWPYKGVKTIYHPGAWAGYRTQIMMSGFVRSTLILFLLLVGSQSNGQPYRPSRCQVDSARQVMSDAAKSGGIPPKQGALKPYKDVVTAEAKTDKGLFTIHRIDDRLLFEIPAVALDKEMLWSTEIAQVPAGFGYGGTAVGSRVIRWTRRNNKIYLRNVDYSLRADSDEKGIQRAIADATLEPIIQAFDVETEGEGKSAVIDVTRFLTSDPAEFAVKGAIGGAGVDPERSYVERVKAFPLNVEMRSIMTFALSEQGLRAHNVGSATVLVHYSMLQLPDKPMRGRLHDSRVGYMTEDFQDFGRPENRVVNMRYIARYRLEKRDPNATVSEPVKPIVYYISREVPVQWRPYLKRAVEAWQKPFERAGFKNAILAKDAPTVEEDPNWDPEDLRYSVIRWAPQAIADASGPHIHDPRSGEIISGHIIIWHDVLKGVENHYWVQCACLDPRAKTLPLPQALEGELLQCYVTHEVGHTLGLTHNFKASSSFTVQQLRDRAFTEKWGDEASIMDYGRFNYVAQPGDGAYLIPKIGPYDYFAIEWGYKPIPDASSPDDEKPELDKLAAKQIEDPTIRFGGADQNGRIDPTVQVEDLGSDPIEATTLGLKNINRIVDMLIPATTKRGESYERLAEMYNDLLTQRTNELFNVTKLVGGVIQTDYHAGRGGEVFRPVAKAKQAQAIQFLLENAFVMPKGLLSPDILNRITPSGVIDRVGAFQRGQLEFLLREDRIKRLSDAQAMYGDRAYTVSAMLTDLQNGIWRELAQPAPVVNLYRRNLQRGYLQIMKTLLTGDNATQTELKPLGLGAIRELRATINKVLTQKRPLDRETKLHLQDSANTITRILNSQ